MTVKDSKKKKNASRSSIDRKQTRHAQIPPGRDRAAQKQKEKRLAHLASFPEMNPNPVVEVDLAGHLHYLNPAARRFFPNLRTKGLHHPWLEDLEVIGRMLAKKEARYHTRELKIGNFWYRQDIYFIPEERRLRIYGFNITDRKQIEEELRSSEERYRGLYEAVSGGILVQDRQGTILEANAVACNILGLTQDEIKGRTIQDPRWRAIHEDGSPFASDDRPSIRALRTGIANQGTVMGVFNPVSRTIPVAPGQRGADPRSPDEPGTGRRVHLPGHHRAQEERGRAPKG